MKIIYRVYYPNTPSDLSGGTSSPVMPAITINNALIASCPPRPIITPVTDSVWGRLDQVDFQGVKPSDGPLAFNPPIWGVSNGGTLPELNGNADNVLMTAILSRDFLTSATPLVVLTFRAPTFPDTQTGVPPYSPAQVRYWSMCTDEPITTAAVRCVPDDQAPTKNGFATLVVSDPSNRPSASVLAQWGAAWLTWGALDLGDFLYDENLQQLTSADGVFYYGMLIYRQTAASPLFIQSMAHVAQLPVAIQKAVMGDYWPQTGYCSASQFQSLGAGCIGH